MVFCSVCFGFAGSAMLRRDISILLKLFSQYHNAHSTNQLYYSTALRRVQITPKTSTNITRCLYSRGPVRQVFSQRASDELD